MLRITRISGMYYPEILVNPTYFDCGVAYCEAILRVT